LDERTDIEVVQAVLSGRTEAFETIVKKYQNLVASVAYRLAVHRDDIEDVVSDVFIKIYRNLDSYRPEFRLSTWIHTVATNHVLDHLRRQRRGRLEAQMPPVVRDPAPLASERLAEREKAERVREAMADLPAKYRAALVLMHVDGKGIEEIARILSLPAGTVKTRLARGRVRLAEILRRRCPDLMEGAP
jgi:RNA polymerase sigma-70 factor (ECF subfamily)